jgi:hypothetical protein
MVVRLSISCKQTTVIACVASSFKLYGAVQAPLLLWNHLLTNSEYFICSDSVLPLECSGLFPKHLIHSLIILLHQNIWMGCYASIKQVLGPPFDKMSHTVTVQQACQIQKSDNRNWINQWNVSVGVWTQLENVMPSNAAAGADSNTFITKPIILEIYT